MKKIHRGFSLFEMLIVIFIFGVLGALTTQIIMLSLKSSAKSESLVKVREDLNSTLAIMEREIRGASSVTCDPDTGVINYTNAQGHPGSFACSQLDDNYFVASASARVTGSNVVITRCSFICNLSTSGGPPSVSIEMVAHNNNKSGVEAANISVSTQIYLRNY
jgi:prepilin-type N-terminal cleavage/methylation domain-containing protein